MEDTRGYLIKRQVSVSVREGGPSLVRRRANVEFLIFKTSEFTVDSDENGLADISLDV